ncbi:hypothetical protein CAEBREN_29784, partial [Caenorhabditis brenneri]
MVHIGPYSSVSYTSSSFNFFSVPVLHRLFYWCQVSFESGRPGKMTTSVSLFCPLFNRETPVRHANVSDNELEKIQRGESVRGDIDYK